MKLKVSKSNIEGTVSVPGSKSHTIRAIAVATMGTGRSVLRFPLVSDDTLSALKAAEAFGAGIRREKEAWTITGNCGVIPEITHTVDMGNSGTGLRIFSGMAALGRLPVTFDGDASLRSRPMAPLLDALRMLGVETGSRGGKCPVTIRGPFAGGRTNVDGTSSQYLTALLLAAPLSERDTEICVTNLNEVPYVEMTLDWLLSRGIEFERSEDLEYFRIKGRQGYKPFDRAIPADFSTAAFPLVATAVTGGKARILNLDFEDWQGDKLVFSYLEKMGVDIDRDKNFTDVGPGKFFRGVKLDLNSTPDALPAMAVAACFAEGSTVLGNVPQARIKETDRIECMSRELRKMGADIEELPDGMIINGCPNGLRGAEVESYNDHRIAMALAVAGLASEGSTIINNAEAASVTYPSFIGDFRKLGAAFEVLD